jgi:uncharacterized protein YeaO (DUF488 family)
MFSSDQGRVTSEVVLLIDLPPRIKDSAGWRLFQRSDEPLDLVDGHNLLSSKFQRNSNFKLQTIGNATGRQDSLPFSHLRVKHAARFQGMRIRLKRIYDKPARADGRRVLVDRVWPRGLTKEETQIDDWLKEIAPSTRLRKWFGHDPARWKEFKRRYANELDHRREQVERLAQQASKRTVTLLFGAKDIEHNNAVALKEYIEKYR